MPGLGSNIVGADCSSWGPNIHRWLSEGECGLSDDLFLPLLEVGRRDARDDLGLSKTAVYPANAMQKSISGY